MASKAQMIKMFQDQIKEIRVDIDKINKGEQKGNVEELMKLLKDKQNKLKELKMDKKAKGIDTKDVERMKKDKEKKEKEKKEKLEKALLKELERPRFDIPERNVGIDSCAEKKTAITDIIDHKLFPNGLTLSMVPVPKQPDNIEISVLGPDNEFVRLPGESQDVLIINKADLPKIINWLSQVPEGVSLNKWIKKNPLPVLGSKTIKAEGLPTLNSQWEEKKDIEKRDPFKYIKTEKKKVALAILKKAGFGKKAENLATLNSQAVEHLSQAATALQALHNMLATAKGDDQKVVDWQRDIETLLTTIQKWRSEFPSRVKDFLRSAD